MLDQTEVVAGRVVEAIRETSAGHDAGVARGREYASDGGAVYLHAVVRRPCHCCSGRHVRQDDEKSLPLATDMRPVRPLAEHEQRNLGDLLVADPLLPPTPVGVVGRFTDPSTWGGAHALAALQRPDQRAIVAGMPKGEGGPGPRINPKNGALAGMVLSSASWFVLLFAGFGGKASTCPEGDATWVEPVALACAVIATLAMAAAVWAYRATAGEPSGEWLLGAAGLYVTTLAWAGTLTGAVALFFVNVCSL